MDSESSPARMVSGVRLYSRPGNDFTRRFPLIVDALFRLRSRSCIIDGELSQTAHRGADRSLVSDHGSREEF